MSDEQKPESSEIVPVRPSVRSGLTGAVGSSSRSGVVTMPYVLELVAGPIIIDGNPPYNLPAATNTTLGGVIIPDGGNLAVPDMLVIGEQG